MRDETTLPDSFPGPVPVHTRYAVGVPTLRWRFGLTVCKPLLSLSRARARSRSLSSLRPEEVVERMLTPFRTSGGVRLDSDHPLRWCEESARCRRPRRPHARRPSLRLRRRLLRKLLLRKQLLRRLLLRRLLLVAKPSFELGPAAGLFSGDVLRRQRSRMASVGPRLALGLQLAPTALARALEMEALLEVMLPLQHRSAGTIVDGDFVSCFDGLRRADFRRLRLREPRERGVACARVVDS